MKGSKHFFFVKKKQKTFIRWNRIVPVKHGPANESFFGSFFSKKEHLP